MSTAYRGSLSYRLTGYHSDPNPDLIELFIDADTRIQVSVTPSDSAFRADLILSDRSSTPSKTSLVLGRTSLPPLSDKRVSSSSGRIESRNWSHRLLFSRSDWSRSSGLTRRTCCPAQSWTPKHLLGIRRGTPSPRAISTLLWSYRSKRPLKVLRLLRPPDRLSRSLVQRDESIVQSISRILRKSKPWRREEDDRSYSSHRSSLVYLWAFLWCSCASVFVSCTVATGDSRLTVLLGALIVRYMYDGNASRFALVVVLPFVVLLLAFPANVLVSTFVSRHNTRHGLEAEDS